jgi:soluble lytic murein transglycosylase
MCSSPSAAAARRLVLMAAGVAVLAAAPVSQPAPPPGAGSSADLVPGLSPTRHLPVPSTLAEIWLAPASPVRPAAAVAGLAKGIGLYGAGRYAEALPLVSAGALAQTGYAHHAAFHTARTEFRLGHLDRSRATLAALRAQPLTSYLAEAAALMAGEIEEERGDHEAALKIYEPLARQKTSASEQVLFRLGRAALAAGDRKKAAEAWLRVYYEFPLTATGTAVARELEKVKDLRARADTRAVFDLELGRAERFYGARRYAEAQAAYRQLRPFASGAHRELIDVRVAACDFHLKRYIAARDGLRPFLEKGDHQAEARFYHLSALRELKNHADYLTRTRELVRQFPESPWAEEALNLLGTHYILTSDDARAAEAFREAFANFPAGARAERTGWKLGWWEYRNGNHAETVRVFETASRSFPRSDFRPAFLYWAARAHEHLDQHATAAARYRVVVADYGSSYYGRLAADRLARQASAGRTPSAPAAGVTLVAATGALPAAALVPAVPPPQNGDVVRLLLAAGLYDDALSELQYAQQVWGSSPAIEASIAWIWHQRGDLRRAINLMRRAYPQFLTENGHDLPPDVLRVIYPLRYWDVIRRHAAARNLDPYLVAALINQESTFEPTARSVANAYGLMQILPSTGRRLAQSVGMRQFAPSMLTNPETNIRLGTTFMANLLRRFGALHYVLASYNAGEHRVARWRAERPGLEQDEFIDDIPYPETQNYVKRILGQTEDYRRLYGGVAASSE